MWGFAGPLRACSGAGASWTSSPWPASSSTWSSLVFDPRGAPRGPAGLFDILLAAASRPVCAGRDRFVPGISASGGRCPFRDLSARQCPHILFTWLWIPPARAGRRQLTGLTARRSSSRGRRHLASWPPICSACPLTIGASGSFSVCSVRWWPSARSAAARSEPDPAAVRTVGPLLFVLGFLMPGVNNIAHAGGFVSSSAARLRAARLVRARRRDRFDQLLATVCIVLTLLCLRAGRSWSAFLA